jgi:3-hydroxyisobutyrate dehydrogenase
MATRLLASGFDVDVWSRRPESTRSLVDLGATAYSDVTLALATADVVVTMLPSADVTKKVIIESKGLAAMRHGAIWVQMATIGVEATEGLFALVGTERPDVNFIDAPVSGSRAPAESGTLLILASGDLDHAQPLERVFSVLGRRTMRLGPVGAGSRLKLILNTWLAFQVEGAAETVSLARRLQLNPSLVQEALADNPLASPYALAKLDTMIRGFYHPDFAIDLALKDLDLTREDAGADAAPVAAAIADRWRGLVENGARGLDVSAAAEGLAKSVRRPT